MSRVTFFILSFEYMRQFYHLKLLKSALVVHCLTFIWNKKRLIKGRFWDEKAKGGFLFWKVLRENQLYNFFLLLGLANHLPPGGFVRPSGVGGVEIWKKKKKKKNPSELFLAASWTFFVPSKNSIKNLSFFAFKQHIWGGQLPKNRCEIL